MNNNSPEFVKIIRDKFVYLSTARQVRVSFDFNCGFKGVISSFYSDTIINYNKLFSSISNKNNIFVQMILAFIKKKNSF